MLLYRFRTGKFGITPRKEVITMGIRDWFGGKTYSRSSTSKSGATEHSQHSLKGTPESHDHSWVRTTTYPSGSSRTVMGETGRHSVARDEGRSADRSGPRGGHADRDRERR